MATFIKPEQMNRLYERFILEYYAKEHPELSVRTLDLNRKFSEIAAQLDHIAAAHFAGAAMPAAE